MQHDLKRLLAYHSVENIGIILIGSAGHDLQSLQTCPLLAALGLIAGLYHINEPCDASRGYFSWVQGGPSCHRRRNMEEMGGLIHRMPWTAALFLIGCV